MNKLFKSLSMMVVICLVIGSLPINYIKAKADTVEYIYNSKVTPYNEVYTNTYTDSETGITWAYKEVSGEATEVHVLDGSNISAITTLAIPSTLNGLPVVSVGLSLVKKVSSSTYYTVTACGTFNNSGTPSVVSNNNISKVILPSTIKEIKSNSFCGFSKLATVNLPEGLTTIGSSAFSSTVLSDSELPSTVTSVGSSAFNRTRFTTLTLRKGINYSSCYNNITTLKTVIVEDGVTSLGGMFSGCTGLVNIDLGSTVEYIGIGTFANCTSLSSIDLPVSMLSLGNNSFQNCTSLVGSLTVPPNVTEISTGFLSGATKITDLYVASANAVYYGTALSKSIKLHGIEGSSTQAYAKANGMTFTAWQPEVSPSISKETKTYDKYINHNIVLSFYLGSGNLSATGISKLEINGTEISTSLYDSSSNSLSINGDVFSTYNKGDSVNITVTFNDSKNTVISNIKVNIIDSKPFILPYITNADKTFDRLAPANISWSYNYGTEASDLQLFLNESEIERKFITVTSDTVLLSQTYLTSLVNGTYTLTFKFNDTDSTRYTSKLFITGVIPEPPVVNVQAVRYIGSAISYTVGFGNVATDISKVYVNGVELPVSYYTVSDNHLEISNDYLSVLNNGMYSINLTYNDGTLINNKLSFTIPKDTSNVTPANSVINVIYVTGSTSDVVIPIGGNPTSVKGLYLDSNYVDSQYYSFDSFTDRLTISHTYLDSLGKGTHSMLLDLEYESSLNVAMKELSPRSFMAVSVGYSNVGELSLLATSGETGIIISSIDGGTTGLTYHVNPDGNTVIDGYTGNQPDVKIPSEVNGSPVTGITDLKDSDGNTNVGSVTIPGSVTDITPGAITSGTNIIGTPGSAAEQYANNNGNTFTNDPNSGSGSGENGSGQTGPSVPSQTIPYDLNRKDSITVTGVKLGNASAVDYIIMNGFKIYSNGVVELLNTSSAMQLAFNGSTIPVMQLAFSQVGVGAVVSPSAIDFTGVPFTLKEDGSFVINGELLAKLGLTASQSYNMEIGFNDGSVVSNAVKVAVTKSSNNSGSDPSGGNQGNNGNNPGGNGNGGSTGGNGGSSSGGDTVSPAAPIQETTPMEITLPNGPIDQTIDASKPIDVTIPVKIEPSQLPNTDVIINDKPLNHTGYELTEDTLTIGKDTVSHMDEGINTIGIIIKDNNGKVINNTTVGKITLTHPKVSEPVVSTVRLTKTIKLGSKLNINRHSPQKGTSIRFSSSNNKVAVINKNGVISTKKAGAATITAKVSSAGRITYYKIKVLVINNAKNSNAVSHNLTVYKGKGKKLFNGTKFYTVQINNPKIVTVSKTGIVKGLKLGKTKIKVTENIGRIDLVHSLTVTVNNN